MSYLVHAGLVNAVLALVPAILAMLCRWRGGHARLVRGLWVIALVKLLTPPVLNLPVGWMGEDVKNSETRSAVIVPAGTPGESSGVLTAVMTEVKTDAQTSAATPTTPVNVMDEKAASLALKPVPAQKYRAATMNWEEAVAFLWCAGAAVVLLWGVHQIAAFGKLARSAVSGSEELEAMTRHMGATLNLRQVPQVGLLEAPMSPVLWGLGLRPRIVLPKSLWERLTHGQREALLAHELAHYRRGDHWVRWIEFTCQVLYWWHPLVWAGARQMRIAEEEATDGMVVSALPAHGADYARALLAVVDLVAQTRWRVPAGASGMSEFTDLTRRMKMIMEPRKRTMSWMAWTVLATGSLALVPILPVGCAGASEAAPPSVTVTPGVTVAAGEAQTTLPSSGTIINNDPAVQTTELRNTLIEEERKRIDETRQRLDDTRRQVEDARRTLEEASRQAEIATHERTKVSNGRELQLRELELQEFMDTGKNITTARLEAELKTWETKVRTLEAKSKRLAEAFRTGRIPQEEADSVEGDLETAQAQEHIADLTLNSWQKYGIEKRRLELEQQLEAARISNAIQHSSANQTLPNAMFPTSTPGATP